MLDTGRSTEALGRDRADHGESILHAMMKFPEDQLLQFVGGIALLGFDPSLNKQSLRVYPGLFEQEAKAVVFR